jgi:hypothetical protein
MGSTANRIKDIGPQPQSYDIENATKENANYRLVAWSERYLQVTLMSSSPPAETLALKRILRPISSCASKLASAEYRWVPRRTN